MKDSETAKLSIKINGAYMTSTFDKNKIGQFFEFLKIGLVDELKEQRNYFARLCECQRCLGRGLFITERDDNLEQGT